MEKFVEVVDSVDRFESGFPRGKYLIVGVTGDPGRPSLLAWVAVLSF
jgi:hypothetical protein